MWIRISLLFASSMLLFAEDLKVFDQWKLVLEYGINTEVLTTLDQITEAKEAALAKTVYARIESSQHTEVLKKTFQYFSEIHSDLAITKAIDILSNFQLYGNDVLLSVLAYVELFPNQNTITVLSSLLDHEEMRPHVVRTIGKLGGEEETRLLESWFEYTDEIRTKENILLALADIASPSSITFLSELLKKRGLSSELTRYTIHALSVCGKGLSHVYEQIIPFLYSEQEWTRVYALSSLAHFDDPEMKEKLLNALRDEFWRVRLEAVNLAEQQGFRELFPAISYKVRYDPAIDVRLRAAKTLAKWNDVASWKLLYELLESTGSTAQLRAEILILALQSDSQEERARILRLIERELNNRSPLLMRVGGFLSEVESQSYADIAHILLSSSDPGLLISALKYIKNNRLKEFLSAVQNLLESPYPAVVYYAEAALLKISD